MLANAQSSSKFQAMAFPYINTDVGTSYGVAGQYHLKNNWYINAGLKLHQNTMFPPTLKNEPFHHRFRAPNTARRIGYTVGMRYELPWMYSRIRPYLYEDITLFKMDTRTYADFPKHTIATDSAVLVMFTGYKNLISLENGLGIGILTRITGKLYLNTKAGLGCNFIFNLPESDYRSGMYINPAVQYAIGLEYQF